MPIRPATWPRALVRVLVAIVAAACVTATIGPDPVAVGYLSGGDAMLVAQVRALVAGPEAREAGVEQGFRALAVGVVTGASTTYAFVGDRGDGKAPDESTTFELASITKTFTAHLLADAVTRREVRLTDPLSRHLPELSGSAAGTVTLEELATHRSGLPAYSDQVAAATYEGVGSADLSEESAADVIRQTRGLVLAGRGTWQYSNLGVSLLGFALARAAGEPSWESLVRHRILDPLGMTHTTFARSQADVPASAAAGHRVNGRVVTPVTGGGYLPAGTTTFTTVADLAAYARALLAGTVPGMWAMVPRVDLGGERIGLVWYTESLPDGDVQFHTGGVPGFSSVLIIDQRAGRAVIVLGNSEQSVDAVGFHLIDPASPVGWFAQSPVDLLLGIVGLVSLGAAVVVGVRARRPYALVAAGLAAQGGLLLVLRRGPWHQVPAWTWGILAALVFWLVLRMAERWAPSAHRSRDVVIGVLGLVLAVGLSGALMWLG